MAEKLKNNIEDSSLARLEEIKNNLDITDEEMANLSTLSEARELLQEKIAENKNSGIIREIDKIKENIGEKSKKADLGEKEKRDATKSINNAEIKKFIFDFKLESSLPAEFEKLDEAQKLKVVRDMKQRVVDLVKSNAPTQYSEYLKEKAGKGIKKFFKSKFTKGMDMQRLENEAFKKLSETEEGRKMIVEDLQLLSQNIKDRKIEFGDNKEIITAYLEDSNIAPNETAAIKEFNKAANKFAHMPYEWGQEKKRNWLMNFYSLNEDNKRIYEKAKEAYERAKEDVLNIKVKRENYMQEEEKGKAMLEISTLDSSIKMEQLLNTHPEFEKEMDILAKDPNAKEWANRFLDKAFKGMGLNNKALIGVGYGLRMGARGAAAASGATIITGIAAPVIGGVIGLLRGGMRGNQTLEERKVQARHGQKDATKEKARMVDIKLLTKGLEKMNDLIENTTITPEIKAKTLTRLSTLIKYSQEQIEEGQVNFGDAKSALVNQFNFINNLNKALVLKETLSGQNDIELKKRIDGLMKTKEKKMNEKVSEAQKSFIKKQILKGAVIGAGAATFGYALRAASEHWGWGEYVSKHMPWHHENSSINSATVKPPTSQELSGANTYQEALDNASKKVDAGNFLKESAKQNNENFYESLHNADHAKLSHEGLVPISENIPKTEEVTITFKKGMGGIEGIKELKKLMRDKYPDMSKAPKNIQDFLNDQSLIKQSEKFGFFNPNDPSGMESAKIIEDSTLNYDSHGSVIFHDASTGKDTILIDGEKGVSGHISVEKKYNGKMFDSDHSGSANNDIHDGGNNITTGHEVEHGTHILPEQKDPVITDNNDAQIGQHGAAPDVKNGTTTLNQNQGTGKQLGEQDNSGKEYSRNNFDNNNNYGGFHLTHDQEYQVNKSYSEIMNSVFKGNLSNAEAGADKQADFFMNLNEKYAPTENALRISKMEHHLYEITGLRPMGPTLINPRAETVGEYMHRALSEAALRNKMGSIDLHQTIGAGEHTMSPHENSLNENDLDKNPADVPPSTDQDNIDDANDLQYSNPVDTPENTN